MDGEIPERIKSMALHHVEGEFDKPKGILRNENVPCLQMNAVLG
jgi:hypothetical protein